MQTWVAIILILGSILFLAAAFSPISGRVFSPRVSPQEQIAAVESDRTQWVLTSALFGAGSVVAVAGLFLFARHVSDTASGTAATSISYIAAMTAAIGALFWVVVVYYRMTHTPEEIFLGGSLSGNWLFPTYTVLTQVALVAVGYVLLQAGYPGWLGWGMIVLVSLTIVAMLIFRDMPPFVHYVWLLIMGITLLVATVPQAAPATTSLPH